MKINVEMFKTQNQTQNLSLFMMNRLIVLIPFVFSICKRVFPLYANEIAVPKIGNNN